IAKLEQRPPRETGTLEAVGQSALLGKRIKALLQAPAVGFHLSQGIGLLQDVEHLEGSGYRGYFACKCKADEDFLKQLHEVSAAEHTSNRETVTHRFAKTSQVRSNP